VPPPLLPALGLALRALFREAWLLAAGLLFAAARRVLGWPALAVAWALLSQATALSLRGHPFDPGAAVEGALEVAASPRFLGIVGGLWLAGLVLGAAFRVAWIAGAVPVLGEAMAGGGGGSARFVEGLGARLPRVLAAAVLASLAEASGGLFALALALGGVQLSGRAAGSGIEPVLAAAVALALVLAVAVPLALGSAADAAVSRAALLGEGPLEAFAAATRRFLLRPGTFVLAALAFGLLGGLAPAAVEGAGGVLTGFARGVRPAALLGPDLMVAVAAAIMAAAVDLTWLGTISALACGEDRR